jgi:hypothetical protein
MSTAFGTAEPGFAPQYFSSRASLALRSPNSQSTPGNGEMSSKPQDTLLVCRRQSSGTVSLLT